LRLPSIAVAMPIIGVSPANSRVVTCWVTAYMPPARTIGVRIVMSPSGTLPWLDLAGVGARTGAAPGGGAGRGGRLNGMVPAAVACRSGSTATGRSSSRAGRTSRSSAPSRSGTPSASGTGAVTGSPATQVPLWDRRSSIVTSPAALTVRVAWRRDRVASRSSSSQPGARPTVWVPGTNGNRRPASRPFTTTSTRPPAAWPGRSNGRSSGRSAHRGGLPPGTSSTVAPSCRPDSVSSKSASTGRPPMASPASDVGARARARSSTVADGLLIRTSSSRRSWPSWKTICTSRPN
jgi:hypothetical protein